MKTLKEISKMSPSNYRIIDRAVSRGDVKNWSDRIEITIDGQHHRDVTRKSAYYNGLAESAN